MIDSKSGGGGKNYYDLPPNSEQLLDLIEHVNMNGNIKDIFKACYRLGRKKGISREYDLRKMALYSLRELGRELGRKDYMALADEVIGHHDTVTSYEIDSNDDTDVNIIEKWLEDSVFDLIKLSPDGQIELTDSRHGRSNLIFKDYDEFFKWYVFNCSELYIAKGGQQSRANEVRSNEVQ